MDCVGNNTIINNDTINDTINNTIYTNNNINNILNFLRNYFIKKHTSKSRSNNLDPDKMGYLRETVTKLHKNIIEFREKSNIKNGTTTVIFQGGFEALENMDEGAIADMEEEVYHK
tara:strand:+ start:678 stop:1025 length:348 start_codon:yes stop_codon:yes gene_type:complete